MGKTKKAPPECPASLLNWLGVECNKSNKDNHNIYSQLTVGRHSAKSNFQSDPCN